MKKKKNGGKEEGDRNRERQTLSTRHFSLIEEL
jgi:hypothetical protein